MLRRLSSASSAGRHSAQVAAHAGRRLLPGSAHAMLTCGGVDCSSGSTTSDYAAMWAAMRWQSTTGTTPTAVATAAVVSTASPTGKRRGRPPGRKSRRSTSATASDAAAAVDAAVAAVAQEVFVQSAAPMPQPPPPAEASTAAPLIEPKPPQQVQEQQVKQASGSQASASPSFAAGADAEAQPTPVTSVTAVNTSTTAAADAEASAPSTAAADAPAKSKAPGRSRKAASAPANAEEKAAPVNPFHRDLEESFFSAILHPSDEGGDRIATEPRESTLVYNALTGRMTSETSLTMQCLREIGFGVNAQRQVILEHPATLNALAERVRVGTAAVPTRWPVTIARVVGTVIANKNITDPANAIQQMIQVKTNSVMRSRYASVVSAVGNPLDEAAATGEQPKGLLNGGGAHDPDEAIELNDEQKRVIDIALRGHHMYIGGSAGTGKTVLLRALARRLQGHRLRVAMTATTGVAGCHIGGSTFHHALGVTSRGEFMRRSVILDYDVIIIDEVSMFPLSLFEEFDRVLREEAGTPDLPFGGVQIILCGDFLQLGCINETSLIGSGLFHKNFVKVRLEKQVRQTADSKFASDLQLMRLGIVPSDLKTTVQQLPPGTMVDSAVNLLPTNKEVHAANERELQRLPGEPLTLTPEAGITSLQCETTATLLLRTTKDFNEAEFARHVRSLLQATLDLPRASLLSLYRVYEDGHAMRVMLPPGESVAWRDAMRERFLEIAGLLNDLELGATVTDIVPNGDGLHTPETEEHLHKVMSNHPIAQPLTLKKGCRVLLRANLSSNLVNGSIGTVVDFVECKEESFPEYIKTDAVKRSIERYRVFCFTECGMPVPMVPVVQFYSGEKMAVPPWEFSVGGGPNTHFYSLSSVALPLSLAYAFTVHKVQGLTLVGRVHLELSRMWPCEHLLYVAMSRVRNPEQLSMSSFAANMVLANDTCVQFDKALRGALLWTVADVAKFPISAWKRCNDTIYHLRRRGASLRRLLEGVTSMGGSAGAAPTLMPARAHHLAGQSGSGASRQAQHQQQQQQGGSMHEDRLARVNGGASRGLSDGDESDDGFGGDGSRVKVRVGRHSSSGSDGAATADGFGAAPFNLEHLSTIQQSVLVARRMRKLVRHVERVAKLTDARRRVKSAAKASKADVGVLSATVSGSSSGVSGSDGDVAAMADEQDDADGVGVDDLTPREVEQATGLVAAAAAAAAQSVAPSSRVTVSIGEEHTF